MSDLSHLHWTKTEVCLFHKILNGLIFCYVKRAHCVLPGRRGQLELHILLDPPLGSYEIPVVTILSVSWAQESENSWLVVILMPKIENFPSRVTPARVIKISWVRTFFQYDVGNWLQSGSIKSLELYHLMPKGEEGSSEIAAPVWHCKLSASHSNIWWVLISHCLFDLTAVNMRKSSYSLYRSCR